MTIVRAQPSDGPHLSAIAWEAKAHWGYPPAWMEAWREQLTITPQFIAAHETFAAVLDGQAIGFAALGAADAARCLEHLWILPEHLGKGVGRALFSHAAEQSRASGARCLTIEADPNAEPFYLHLGAVRIGFTQTTAAGEPRQLPLLNFDLTLPR
ncbi:MAG: GNAT family N-acetyltransferase [Spartobacteria bacterium]